MKKIYYNKLIRDKIPEKIRKDGADFKVKKLSAGVFRKELLKKAEEEASALPKARNKKELVAELADVMDVLDEIRAVKKIALKDIKKQQAENLRQKGGFKKRLFLHWTSDSGYRSNEIRRGKNK